MRKIMSKALKKAKKQAKSRMKEFDKIYLNQIARTRHSIEALEQLKNDVIIGDRQIYTKQGLIELIDETIALIGEAGMGG